MGSALLFRFITPHYFKGVSCVPKDGVIVCGIAGLLAVSVMHYSFLYCYSNMMAPPPPNDTPPPTPSEEDVNPVGELQLCADQEV